MGGSGSRSSGLSGHPNSAVLGDPGEHTPQQCEPAKIICFEALWSGLDGLPPRALGPSLVWNANEQPGTDEAIGSSSTAGMGFHIIGLRIRHDLRSHDLPDPETSQSKHGVGDIEPHRRGIRYKIWCRTVEPGLFS